MIQSRSLRRRDDRTVDGRFLFHRDASSDLAHLGHAIQESAQAAFQIARELNVDAVVEGSVVRAGEKVRITARLIRAVTEDTLWAGSYERDLRDVLALQSEVAKSIASEVDVTLTPQEEARLAGARPVDPEAHQLSLLGSFHANKGTEEGLKSAVRYFEQAIAKDPSDACGPCRHG